MPIKTIIDDVNGNGQARVKHAKKDLLNGLMVYTEPFRDYIAQTKPMADSTGSIEANKNAAFSGTPDGVHNGGDNAYWTASALSGTWDFASTTVAQQGSASIDATSTVDNSVAQFERSSSINAANYAAITGYIYITGWPGGGGAKDVLLRVREAGADIGNSVNLSNYINTGILNSWLKFSIPFEDLVLGSNDFDQILITTRSTGGGSAPDYYLDTIQVEETGSYTFSVIPDNGTKLHVSRLSMVMVDAYNGTLADSSHPNIKYNQFLGVSKLSNGINFRLVTDGITRFNGIFKQHADFLTFPGLTTTSGGDATNTWIKYDILFDYPFVLDSRTSDSFTMTLSDDLSGLLYFRVFVRGYRETPDTNTNK